MKAFLHVGMPKTGTSSIQETLAKARIQDPFYLLPDHPNHSGVVRHLFETRGRDRDARGKNVKDEAVARRQAMYHEKLSNSLREADGRNVVFSAERLSNTSRRSIEAVAAYFRQYCDDIQVIGYVRPPRSWATSALQQNLKGPSGASFENILNWADYRSKFEKLDDIFGRENVHLIKFDRASLHGGDVVLDFCERIGATVGPEHHVFENDTLSLEGSALLYIKRKFGEDNWMPARAGQARKMFVAALKGIGSTKLALAPSMFEPLLDANRADLEWMEKRLGASLAETGTAPEGAITGEDSLLDAALRASPMLDHVRPGLAPSTPTFFSIAEALDQIFVESFAASAKERATTRKAAKRSAAAARNLLETSQRVRAHAEDSSRRFSMTDTTDNTFDKGARGALARAMWRANCNAEGRNFENAEERKAAYKNERKSVMPQAGRILRQLEKQGYTLSGKQDA